jgi:hypothetical protein
MNARRLLGVVVVGTGALVVPAHADAPIGSYAQYQLFGPQDCTIVDKFTHLRWQRYPSTAGAVSLHDAIAYCDSLPDAITYCNVGAGWRLPSVKELLTLVDETPHLEYEGGNVYKYIDRNAFPGTPTGSPYWTSSPRLSDYFVVRFDSGTTEHRPSGDVAYVRCVK